MARNILKLDTTGFEKMLVQLDSLGGNVQQAVQDALVQASETITEDTIAAMDTANLPAGGKYSAGSTREAIITDHAVRWEGNVGWVPVGFDFSKPGAGGFLITGTPKMRPNESLHRMYKQKKYMNQIQQDISDVIMDYIAKAIEGG